MLARLPAGASFATVWPAYAPAGGVGKPAGGSGWQPSPASRLASTGIDSDWGDIVETT